MSIEDTHGRRRRCLAHSLRTARYGHTYAIVLRDVDHFRAYNDRYGGEEFLVVLPEQTAEAAVSIADRLRRAVQDLAIAHDANPPEGLVTISSGVATLTPSSDPDDPLKEADAALYEAKEAGRNAFRARDGGQNRAARNPADAGLELEP